MKCSGNESFRCRDQNSIAELTHDCENFINKSRISRVQFALAFIYFTQKIRLSIVTFSDRQKGTCQMNDPQRIPVRAVNKIYQFLANEQCMEIDPEDVYFRILISISMTQIAAAGTFSQQYYYYVIMIIY